MDIDCGYGIKTLDYEIDGGYGHYNVSLIYFDNEIIKLRVTIDNHPRVIKESLLPNINFELQCLNDLIVFEKSFPENVSKYNSKHGRLFIESNDENLRRKQALNYFMDVLHNGEFQSPFYFRSGLGKETFNHLRFFLITKDYNALEDLLFSPSPTVRFFASKTLEYLKIESDYKPSVKISVRIEESLKGSKIIKSGIITKYTKELGYDNYDVNKNFKKYLFSM